MSLTVTSKVRFARAANGKAELKCQPVMKLAAPASTGRVPRISRLMALAIRFDGLLRRAEVKDYAELARLGQVTRARVTQIMNLLNLAPDIQEAILFLPPVDAGRDRVMEWQIRPIAGEPVWERQRRAWPRLVRNASVPSVRPCRRTSAAGASHSGQMDDEVRRS